MDKKNQSLTKKDFKEILSEALKDQSQAIIEAVDFGFENAKKDRVKIKSDIVDIKDRLGSIERRVIYIEDVITRHTKEIKEIKQELKKVKNGLEKLANVSRTKTENIKITLLEKRIGKLELAVA
jgi:gas vesicle protein